jgi:hypothetical protein
LLLLLHLGRPRLQPWHLGPQQNRASAPGVCLPTHNHETQRETKMPVPKPRHLKQELRGQFAYTGCPFILCDRLLTDEVALVLAMQERNADARRGRICHCESPLQRIHEEREGNSRSFGCSHKACFHSGTFPPGSRLLRRTLGHERLSSRRCDASQNCALRTTLRNVW